MHHIGFQAFSAAFLAITLAAGCTVGSGTAEYGPDPAAPGGQEAVGSKVAGLQEDGHLSREQIQTVVRGTGFTQYKECYEGLLAQNSTASGNISLKFTINPDGSMAQTGVASADGELIDANFQQCMLSASQSLVFPAAQQKTDVVYPILMTPGDGS